MSCKFPRCKAEAVAICALCLEPACQKHGATNIHYGPMTPIKREAA